MSTAEEDTTTTVQLILAVIGISFRPQVGRCASIRRGSATGAGQNVAARPWPTTLICAFGAPAPKQETAPTHTLEVTRSDDTRDEMYVQERGPEDGVPIVFLHGSMVAGWMWAEQAEALADTHRTIVPDLPGIGASASDRWTGFAGAAEAVAAEITARAPDGAHIVGLSLGGIVALNLAVAHPDCCRSLLVSGVPAGQLSAPLRMLNRAMASIYGTAFGSRMIGRIFGLPDQESMDAFVATALDTDRSAIKAIIAEVSSKPLPDGLDGISVPVLSVVGEKDTQPARRAVPLLVRSIPAARGAHVPGVGHQWNAEAPELFNEMVRVWVDEQAIHPDLVSVDS